MSVLENYRVTNGKGDYLSRTSFNKELSFNGKQFAYSYNKATAEHLAKMFKGTAEAIPPTFSTEGRKLATMSEGEHFIICGNTNVIWVIEERVSATSVRCTALHDNVISIEMLLVDIVCKVKYID